MAVATPEEAGGNVKSALSRGWATAFRRKSFLTKFTALATAFAAAGLLTSSNGNATAEAEAAQRPPLVMQVFVATRADDCYDNGQLTAIKRLTTLAQHRINREGGVAGRRIIVNFLDDRRDQQLTAGNFATAIADPQTIAMVGLSNATRAKAAFDASGKDLKASGIPFVSDISVTEIIRNYPNVFTSRASEDEERMPVIAEFVKESHLERPGFIGIRSLLASTNLGDSLNKYLAGGLTADRRLRLVDEKLDYGEVAAAVADLKSKNVGIVFLSVGGDRMKDVVRAFKDAGFTPPLFISGRIDALAGNSAETYPNDVYQLAWDGLPGVYNERLRELIWSTASPGQWLFAGRKNARAPGWKDGTCKPRDEDIPLEVLDDANMRALATGTQYADMVRLIAQAARSAEPTAQISEIRKLIVDQLQTAYATGRGIFRGEFDNWSFQPTSRAAARTPLILMLPQGRSQTQLAPLQFLHLRDHTLQRIDTLYADIDLIHAERIDDTDKTFFADFYLSMNDRGGASIEQIEFANAYLEPGSNERQITVRALHDGSKSAAYPDHMKIYQVTGKFVYSPDLRNYPFDTQRFAIELRPKNGSNPFIVQPPPQTIRDHVVSVDGWTPKDQYVGYDEDFVRTVDAQTLEPSVFPFYKASFAWLMKRETTDYFLRVVVPLGFILIIAYLSIFISRHHFEAIVTIQVTALLSAVALYLALPKLDANTETLSDRMFLFTYLMLSVIIAITIARENKRIEPIRWLGKSLVFLHIVAVPAAVAAMAYYVYQASTT
ncbi:ABC transporter substrate-binding protein [Hyphomicrobium sp.]|uniref:ABC transporter substrate-binding protein n=1 Tax=Hyphomicrobium sp. TaxID=82 RepID=UPI002D771275|nr:ABC transporter substrate-binding protein [Hyphomicrobium sp.]HET6389002.1 ABC transporter substrate-binding protein [Hyphomicrobium sp.]